MTNNQKTEKQRNKRTKMLFGHWCLNIGIYPAFAEYPGLPRQARDGERSRTIA
jgi:hypothetical protein